MPIGGSALRRALSFVADSLIAPFGTALFAPSADKKRPSPRWGGL